MYIPLDYYRILGLPIQATTEQLRQAHRDRTLQLPRREYSDTAIASRKQLLDEAYAVLASPEQRQAYDASFLAKTYELTPNADTTTPASVGEAGTDSHTPSIEVQDNQLVGALLILQELGEYELVLKLGRPFLTSGSVSLKDGRFGDPSIVFPDIVLTVALACLELGREQWQQGQYENAAEALDTGQQLLLREGLFIGVRGEIQADLYKLRPYRVLELLALSEAQTEERLRGLQLLQDMLHERSGIDGSGNDQSGLNIDDFLRFIQQLRSYLTAAEQQVLFEEEARRPSAVATYLAVYALLARGFSERQPALVQRAKLLLLRLSTRQDVHLEQAVCTLLLGQTEEASRALELSQEYEPIAFIREHSQGSPDLLPGLCLYAERWLQDEVFPHFRDLTQQPASLKGYFADPQVQRYLEALPNETESVEDWSLGTTKGKVQPLPARQPIASPAPSAPSVNSYRQPEPAFAGGGVSRNSSSTEAMGDRPSNDSLIEAARARIAARTGAATLSTEERVTSRVTTMPAAERVAQFPTEARSQSNARIPSDRPPTRNDRPRGGSGGDGRLGAGLAGSLGSRSITRAPKSKSGGLTRWILPAFVLFSIVTTGFLIAWVWKWMASQAANKQPPRTEQPASSNAASPVPSVSPTTAATGPLNASAAKQVIESWLAAKAAAMGPDYTADKLDEVLVDPKLAEWRAASEEAKRDNWYKQYQHEVNLGEIDQSKDKPDEAKVVAEVTEKTKYYVAGKLENASADNNLRVRYHLVRKDGKWFIRTWELMQ